MSVKIMGVVWDCDLPRNEKYVLLAYADHASHDGTNIYPSIELIAWKTGYDERMVQRITAKLIERGVLVRDGHGPKFTNKYRIDTSALPKRPEFTSKSKSQSRTNEQGWQNAGGDILPGVTFCTKRGGKMPPEPSENQTHNNKADSPENNIPDSNLETVSRTYEQEIGGLSPIIADSIKDALTTYPVEWITKAISRAAEMNKRRWSYVAGILKNWQVIGGPQNDKPQKEKPKYQNSARTYPAPQVSKPKTKLPPGFDLDSYLKKQEESRREIYSEDNDNYATRNQGKPPTDPD